MFYVYCQSSGGVDVLGQVEARDALAATIKARRLFSRRGALDAFCVARSLPDPAVRQALCDPRNDAERAFALHSRRRAQILSLKGRLREWRARKKLVLL